MRRVLIPLDGTAFGEAILPDAMRVAGPDGELILIKDASILGRAGGADAAMLYERHRSVATAAAYLESVAGGLRTRGVSVRTHALDLGDAAEAIDEAARSFSADMIACATHGRGIFGRLAWGSVARRALVHSPVPVLLRHIGENEPAPADSESEARRILVPLDGSPRAEQALQFGRKLASEWNAEIIVTRVVDHQWLTGIDPGSGRSEEFLHLERIASAGPGPVDGRLLIGPVVDALVTAVHVWAITDVVMTSHGRTGLSRVILGSVADGLVHRLHCPIVIIPALVPVRAAETTSRLHHPAATAVP